MSASFDLWLDGPDREMSAGWKQDVKFDFELFLNNESFARWASEHITRTLANLAREVEEIGTMVSHETIRE